MVASMAHDWRRRLRDDKRRQHGAGVALGVVCDSVGSDFQAPRWSRLIGWRSGISHRSSTKPLGPLVLPLTSQCQTDSSLQPRFSSLFLFIPLSPNHQSHSEDLTFTSHDHYYPTTLTL